MADQPTTTPTGQQSATDAAELAFQPGYRQPWEQNNPLEIEYVDYTDDPIAHAQWKADRSEQHAERTNANE